MSSKTAGGSSAASPVKKTSYRLIDPNAPKARMSSYAVFVKCCREEFKRRYPDDVVRFSEFTKKCAERWKNMSDKEKRRFQEMSEEDKRRYDLEMAAYLSGHPIDSVKVKMQAESEKQASLKSPQHQSDNYPSQQLSPSSSSSNNNSNLMANLVSQAAAAQAAVQAAHVAGSSAATSSADAYRALYGQYAAVAAGDYDVDGKQRRQRRRKKQFKDPMAPKRSMSAFFWFSREERAKVKAANPDFGVGEMAKELSRRWTEASHQTREKYENDAKNDRARYIEQKREYYNRTTGGATSAAAAAATAASAYSAAAATTDATSAAALLAMQNTAAAYAMAAAYSAAASQDAAAVSSLTASQTAGTSSSTEGVTEDIPTMPKVITVPPDFDEDDDIEDIAEVEEIVDLVDDDDEDSD